MYEIKCLTSFTLDIQLINELEHYINILLLVSFSTQYLVYQEGDVVNNLIAKALADRIIRAAKFDHDFQVKHILALLAYYFLTNLICLGCHRHP